VFFRPVHRQHTNRTVIIGQEMLFRIHRCLPFACMVG